MVRKMRDIMSPAPVCMAPGESVRDSGIYDNLTRDNAGTEIPVAEAIQRGAGP